MDHLAFLIAEIAAVLLASHSLSSYVRVCVGLILGQALILASYKQFSNKFLVWVGVAGITVCVAADGSEVGVAVWEGASVGVGGDVGGTG